MTRSHLRSTGKPATTQNVFLSYYPGTTNIVPESHCMYDIYIHRRCRTALVLARGGIEAHADVVPARGGVRCLGQRWPDAPPARREAARGRREQSRTEGRSTFFLHHRAERKEASYPHGQPGTRLHTSRSVRTPFQTLTSSLTFHPLMLQDWLWQAPEVWESTVQQPCTDQTTRCPTL